MVAVTCFEIYPFNEMGVLRFILLRKRCFLSRTPVEMLLNSTIESNSKAVQSFIKKFCLLLSSVPEHRRMGHCRSMTCAYRQYQFTVIIFIAHNFKILNKHYLLLYCLKDRHMRFVHLFTLFCTFWNSILHVY